LAFHSALSFSWVIPDGVAPDVRFRPVADIPLLAEKWPMKRDKHRWPPPLWVSSGRHGETLVDDLQLLLGDLCREWGFCNALADDVLPPGGDAITADAFAKAVLVAEGWPEAEMPGEWREMMTKVFEHRYGAWISPSEYKQRRHG
jgi:hypothetical protein